MIEKNLFSIELNGLSVAYEHKRVLSNIFLKIEPGYVYGLIGPNGAGKSTLFKAILNLIEPNSGEIKILNSNTAEMLTKIAYVPQKDEVDWTFPATVYDIVAMGRYPHKKVLERMNAQDKKIIQESMEKLDIVKLKDKQIGELSGGQQQRVFLARALSQQAEILLMDEPFVGVDIKTELKIIQILKDLAKSGKTVLVVHHDLDSVQSYFDRVILINVKLMAYGDTSQVFTKENISATFASPSHLFQNTGFAKT
jgi:ABC-type Mn2+/Zn2+ transport system ATPase subunit